MSPKKIMVIIPALNEENTVARVIEEIPRADMESLGYSVEIVVVDNNSTDRTKQIAEEKGARVIHEPVRGKGRAITTAFKIADADCVFILDADYTYPATHLSRMLQMLEKNDVVLGSRLRGKMEKGAMTSLNRLGNHLLALMASILYRRWISDLCTGCWGFRGTVVKDLKMDATGFDLEANFFTQLAKKRYRIAEVPIGYRRRWSPSKLNSLKDGFIIGRTLIRRRFQRE